LIRRGVGRLHNVATSAKAAFHKPMRSVGVEVAYVRANEVRGRLSVSDDVASSAETLKMTVRVNARSERASLLNSRFFYRDSRVGTNSECFGEDYGLVRNWGIYLLGLLKFVMFFLATVGLMIDQSAWATEAALFLISWPIALQNVLRQSLELAFKVKSLLRAKEVLAQLSSVSVRHELRARIKAVLRLHKQIAGYVSIVDLIDVLQEPSTDAVVDKLEEIATAKYNCELDKELAKLAVQQLIDDSKPDRQSGSKPDRQSQWLDRESSSVLPGPRTEKL